MYPINFEIKKGRGNSGRLEETINGRNYFLNPKAIKYESLKKEMKGLQNKLNQASIYSGGRKGKPQKYIGVLSVNDINKVAEKIADVVAEEVKEEIKKSRGRPKGSKNVIRAGSQAVNQYYKIQRQNEKMRAALLN